MKIKIYETVKNKNDILTLERFNSMLSYASGPNGEKAVYISGGNLAANSIYGASIVSKSLTAEQIKAESITGDLIKAGSITTSHITAGGIDAQVIKTGILKSIVDPLTIGSLINLDTGDLSLAGGNLTWNSSKKEFYINANRITIGGNNLLTEKTDLAKMINDDPNTTVIDGKKLHFTSDVKMDSAYITKLTTNDLFMENVNSYSINANRINSGSLSANFISGGTIDANDVSVINLNASSITSGTINADTISVINLDASNITTGIMDANTVSIVNLNASNITSGTIDANNISVTNLNASNIKSGTIDASLISVINLDASNITAGSLDISEGLKLVNGPHTIIQANNKGEIEMNVSKLSINALPVATKNELDDRINNIELTPGPQGPQGPQGDRGSDGLPGKDGVGISKTTILYGISTSESIQPTEFSDTVPPLVKGQYLWTKTEWTYTDSSTEVGYTKSYIAKDGNTGKDGIAGKDGVGITKTTITYAKSTNGTTAPTSGWGKDVPSANPGEYIWTKTVWKYTDSTTETGYSVGKIGNTGAKGDKGDKGDTGPKGATGSQGPRGNIGTSVVSVTEYYLATSASSGIQSSNSGFKTTMQPLTATNKYLWNYEKINFSDGTSQPTIPVIIGVYGDKGQTGSTGATGRSIVSITEHYLATSASSGVTRSTSGWDTKMQPTTETNKYLWNYETIKWSSGTTTTYVEPIIIGVHGAKGSQGPQGKQGPQGIRGPAGTNGQSQWVHIRYSANSNGSSMDTKPSSTTKYVGIAVTNSATAPAYTGFTWSKYVGEDGSKGAQGPQGVPGKNGTNGKTTYTWIRYADTPTSGMNQYPDGKKYIGLAFNKNTQTESSNYSDYQWSLMPQNIEVGGRNLLKNSGKEVSNGSYNIARYDLTDEIKKNEEVTLTIWGSLATTKTNFRAYNSGGNLQVAILTDNGDGTYSSTFKWYIGGSTNTYLNIYAFTNAQTGTSTINKIKLEKGNIATDWTPAPEDVQSDIDSKADSEATEQALNEATALLQTLQQEVQAAALDGELKDFIKQYNEEQKALDADKKESNKRLQEALNSVSSLTNNMKNMSETWNFVDRFIKNTKEGIVVGNHEEGSYILIKEDRLSFFSNNEEVAFIAQNLMEISRGAFVEQIQISQYIFEKYGTNQLAIRYAG